MTVYADELVPGMTDSFTKVVSERDVQMFAEATGDHNPLHLDAEYAASTVFGERVAHGGLTLSLLSAVFGTKLPGPGTIVLKITTRFLQQVRIGDTVTAAVTVRRRLPKNCFLFDCTCKVGDTQVVEAEALVMAPARP